MDWITVLLCTLALLCALGAGFSLGRQTPSWKEDRAREYVPGPGEFFLYGSSYIGGRYLFAFFGSAWGSALLALLGFVLASCFWPGSSNLDLPRRGALIILLFRPSTGALLLAAALGYAWAVLTDKGPAGPLR